MVGHWEDAEELITEVQKAKPTAYIAFKKYAQSWQRNVLINNHD